MSHLIRWLRIAWHRREIASLRAERAACARMLPMIDVAIAQHDRELRKLGAL